MKKKKKFSREEILEQLRDLEEKQRLLEESDPFWFYKPSDGTIPESNKAFLEKHILPEDIPERLDSQMNIHMSTANIIGGFGGNQVGKTLSGAIEVFIAITGEVPNSLKGIYPEEKLNNKRPFHARVVGEDYVNGLLKNVIPTFRKWVPREFLIDGSWEKSFSVEQGTLRLGKKGELYGTVEFMSNKQAIGSFQGPARHMVLYDEEPVYEIHKENLMRFTTSDRVRIMFQMTPTKGLSWVSDKILNSQGIDDKNSIECFKMASITNRYANLNVLEEIVAGLSSYEEIKMRVLGEFVSLSGRVYKHFNRSIHVIEPFKITDNYMVLTGMDPHQTTPTAVVFVAVDRENIPYVIDSYWGNKARDIEEVKADIGLMTEKWRMAWSVVDQSSDVRIEAFGGLNIFDTLRRSPNQIKGLRKSIKYPGSIDAGVEEIKRRLKCDDKGNPGFYIFDTPNNRVLINSMLTLERDVALNEEKKGQRDKIMEGKHHFHAALRYVFQFPIRYIESDYGRHIPEYKPESMALNY